MTSSTDPREPEEPPIRFTDNRKIRRDAAEAAGTTDAADETLSSAAAGAADEATAPSADSALLEERTADLQRLQAEYANYRRRAERERSLAGDAAVARVLSDLLPVIDDLERAKAHGDLTGPLKAVADKLEGVTTKLGLTAFGQVGDPFDPSRHEAVLHDESSEVSVPTCTTVMRPGYTVHDRLLRPAMVGVSDPTPGSAGGATETAGEPAEHADQGDASAGPHNDEPEGDQPPIS